MAPTDRPPPARLANHRAADASFVERTPRKLHRSAWQGGTYSTSTGEPVRILVSDSYPDGSTIGRRWADFFGSLVHGPELQRLTAYVVTPDELEYVCGPSALGCYGGGEMAFTNETLGGVLPEDVARHEYGHHVAANRLNPPWNALDWGPKRWASAANVCRRTQQGTAHPGDEETYYRLNPGEAFAEVYRVLNELEAGATSFTWQTSDGSFSPDTAALQAAEQDVVAPWTVPVTQAFRGRFVRQGKRVWRITLATPLDGDLAVSLTFPQGSLDELAVLAPGVATPLASGLWFGTTEKRLATTICGQRTVVLRVTQRGALGRFVLRVTRD